MTANLTTTSHVLSAADSRAPEQRRNIVQTIPWTAQYEERLKAFISSHPKDQHGAHRYTPEQFGQSAEELDKHFAPFLPYPGDRGRIEKDRVRG